LITRGRRLHLAVEATRLGLELLETPDRHVLIAVRRGGVPLRGVGRMLDRGLELIGQSLQPHPAGARPTWITVLVLLLVLVPLLLTLVLSPLLGPQGLRRYQTGRHGAGQEDLFQLHDCTSSMTLKVQPACR